MHNKINKDEILDKKLTDSNNTEAVHIACHSMTVNPRDFTVHNKTIQYKTNKNDDKKITKSVKNVADGTQNENREPTVQNKNNKQSDKVTRSVINVLVADGKQNGKKIENKYSHKEIQTMSTLTQTGKYGPPQNEAINFVQGIR